MGQKRALGHLVLSIYNQLAPKAIALKASMHL